VEKAYDSVMTAS